MRLALINALALRYGVRRVQIYKLFTVSLTRLKQLLLPKTANGRVTRQPSATQRSSGVDSPPSQCLQYSRLPFVYKIG